VTPPSPDADDRVAALGRSLAALGASCQVEARGRLAVVVPDAGADPRLFGAAEWRVRALRAAATHGFTHLALELGDGPPARELRSADFADESGRAPLPRP
jgi:hypothetical protein